MPKQQNGKTQDPRDYTVQIRVASVLDTDRNLGGGLVSGVYYTPDDKNANVGWAVDARVLAFPTLNLPLATEPLPRTAGPARPKLPDPRLAYLRPVEPVALNGAPPPLESWVGRDDLLRALDADDGDPTTRITALVGFGGEGKSSLARRWVEGIVEGQTSGSQEARVRRSWMPAQGQITHPRCTPHGLRGYSGGRFTTRRRWTPFSRRCWTGWARAD